jgi:hypothetical protein
MFIGEIEPSWSRHAEQFPLVGRRLAEAADVLRAVFLRELQQAPHEPGGVVGAQDAQRLEAA